MSILSTLGLDAGAGSSPYAQYILPIAITGLILVNLKGVPGFWHVRLFKGLFTQYVAGDHKPKNDGPNGRLLTVSEDAPRLFSYLVTTHRNSPIECDYNMHKSNSTFFSDLDINRSQLLLRIFGGFPRWESTAAETQVEQKKKKKQGERSLNIALGGVSCVFKREIKPLQQYEIWSRVLAWDEKWLYVVSYFVKAGTGKAVMRSLHGDQKSAGFDPNKVILASSLSRYVFKDGRITVQPQDVLIHNGLHPAPGSGSEKEGKGASEKSTQEALNVFASQKERGLEVARFFHGLDTLPAQFGESTSIFGCYGDL
ncbi:acyl-CoA thioesterase [Aspergillus clavatus NRRL 1]|uniref:Capsule polysaccharide biosynthesis protein n=1 Tax=Aspergillus clavatus (strain ATCC 1007 / CBS 513.65 / DSM 816 / NCTC 3887 / NRRL 1 / QM 1276 / 107) TaxID=344612 RepID=A1CFN4_ASPCL|nr:uncharacterized protein ACLA_093820 [Aspergillus clavatus NRRL 1]EAW11683.1 conserved hypothetical protein [Aspergillus clavatus NRRL 1]